jgi:hypothetical protein
MRVRLRQQRLLNFLAQSRLSQNHWALKLGISRGHWSEIVNGKHPYPSPKCWIPAARASRIEPAITLRAEH